MRRISFLLILFILFLVSCFVFWLNFYLKKISEASLERYSASEFEFQSLLQKKKSLTKKKIAERDQKIIAQFDKIREKLVLFFGKDGNFDRLNCENLKDICKKIKELGGELNIVKDREFFSQNICLFTKLNQKEKWYCLDSWGKEGITEKDPSFLPFCNPNGNIVCPITDKK